MNDLTIIGLDTAKSVFQLCGINGKGEVVLERRLRRGQLLAFFAKLAPVTVALEACGAAHYWARAIAALGHRAKIVPPGYVKRFAEGRGKSDRRDAAALCFSARSRDLREVPVKSEAEQAWLAAFKVRSLLVRQRTMLANALRGHAGEFGMTAKTGDTGLEELIARIESGAAILPGTLVPWLAALARQWRTLGEEIARMSAALLAQAKADPVIARLMGVPGAGPLTASLFALKVGDAARFACGRQCAAWLGLTPAERSSGDKRRLGAVSKAGDEDLRAHLVLGAATVLIRAKRDPAKADPWVRAILRRKPFKVAAVALAGRMARTLWAMLKHGTAYAPRRSARTLAA